MMSAEHIDAVPPSLSANVKDSFAYLTVKDRLPVILAKICDSIYRNRDKLNDSYGNVEGSSDALKFVIGQMSRLRHELTTNKPITLLEDQESPDIDFWDIELIGADHRLSPDSSNDPESEEDPPRHMLRRQGSSLTQHSWFNSSWLLVECYMYRRISEAVARSGLPQFDPFRLDKENSFWGSESAIRVITLHLFQSLPLLTSSDTPVETRKMEFIRYLMLALFGNECDLSISGMSDNVQTEDPLGKLTEKQKMILVNESELLWDFLNTTSSKDTIVIILDNSGFELLTDLCLAEFFISCGFARRIVFYGKCIPWFVSDVTEHDFKWTLHTLVSSNHLGESRLGSLWLERLKNGTFEYRNHVFWTLPVDYARMASVSPDLHDTLAEIGKLIVFKGDLNYRKLLGDLDWPKSSTFRQALRGFHPAPLVALRVCKADLAVGLTEVKVSEVSQECENWQTVGKYALVQICFS